MEVVELLLDYGAQLEQSGAIHHAAKKGRIAVMNFILKRGADIDEQLWKNDYMFSSRHRTKLKRKRHHYISAYCIIKSELRLG